MTTTIEQFIRDTLITALSVAEDMGQIDPNAFVTAGAWVRLSLLHLNDTAGDCVDDCQILLDVGMKKIPGEVKL